MKKVVFFIFFIFLIVLFIFHASILTGFANFLIVKDVLHKTDVLIILSGNDTVLKGVELYKKGYADKIILAGRKIQWNTYATEIMKKQVISLGVPKDVILLANVNQKDQFPGEAIISVMTENGLKSSTIIAHDYLSRRVKKFHEKQFLKKGYSINIYPLPTNFNPLKWWKNPKHIEVLVHEYYKLLFY